MSTRDNIAHALVSRSMSSSGAACRWHTSLPRMRRMTATIVSLSQIAQRARRGLVMPSAARHTNRERSPSPRR